uniref:Uncharacterized protein n=1 Tax=Anguilla anguilla TaxID=7936 RepID=A0A0E9ST50_ANGAN
MSASRSRCQPSSIKTSINSNIQNSIKCSMIKSMRYQLIQKVNKIKTQ